MKPILHIVSLNIEWGKHLPLTLPFLARERPDVACLQEVLEGDIPKLAEALDAPFHSYAPTCRFRQEGKDDLFGTAIFSKTPLLAERAERYHSSPGHVVPFDHADPNATMARVLLSAEVEKEGERFRLVTTHFTWTPDGNPDDVQREDLQKLLALLEPLGEFALMGDFNAPRGRETFDTLAERFTDNIPSEYETSIDNTLHRRAPLTLMVDGLFTTKGYSAEHVRLESGVSDHLAIVANLSKRA